MKRNQRLKKTGKHSPLRGTRVPRTRHFRRMLDTESGVKVRSRYEVICANYLHRNKIEFKYEPLMLIRGKQVRPDFYLPEHNLFLEICGYGHMPYYRERNRLKKQLYANLDLRTVFIHHDGKGSLERKIHERLKESGLCPGGKDGIC